MTVTLPPVTETLYENSSILYLKPEFWIMIMCSRLRRS